MAFRKKFLKDNPVCPVMTLMGRTVRTKEIHHKRGRLGPLLTDTRHWLAVSKLGHRLIHASPEWARRNGFLCQVGEWNRTEDVT